MSKRKYGNEVGAGPTQRQLRVGETIRHALAEMLVRGDIHDDVIAGHVITVSEVRMSPDLKLARVYIMPLGGDDIQPVIKALARNKGQIRREIGRAVQLKYTPDLRFFGDDSFDEASRIDSLLHSPRVRQDIEKE